MDILIITTFTDSLLKAKLIPLVNLTEVSSVVLICDKQGPKIDKVRYKVPPTKYYRFLLHKSIAKLFVLYQTAKRNKYDFVMAYNIFPHGINAWLIGKMMKLPIIIHLPGGYAELDIKKNNSDNSLIKSFPILSTFVKIINEFVIRRVDYIFVPGSNTKEYLIRKSNFDPQKIFFIHSSINTYRFMPRKDVKFYDLILTSAFREVKRVDLFIKIISLMKKEYPKIKAIVVGDGPLKDSLNNMILELNLRENVQLIGFEENPEKYYWKSKIFVLASTTEGISTAVMEAMACGLPAVVSDVGDMKDIIVDNITGFIIKPEDNLNMYIKKIKLLLNDFELYERFSLNAREIIEENHSFKVIQSKWHNFFTQFNET